MANYLHGVETVLVKRGPRPVNVVKAAVIGLIGLAPVAPEEPNESVFDDTFDETFTGAGIVNSRPYLVLNESDAAAFGAPIPGFTIPQALDAIFDQGAGTVVVVNVYDPVKHDVQETDEAVAIVNFRGSTAFAPLSNLVITKSGFTYQSGIHYQIDPFGNITFIGDAVTGAEGVPVATGSVIASYKRLDPSLVTNADIIGGISGNIRSGLEVFDMTKPLMGFKPRILIAPGYSQIPAIKTELISKAKKYFGFTIIDGEAGWTRAQAVADRGPTGTIFNSREYAAVAAYPRVKRYDAATDAEVVYPYSPFLAGVWTASINERGYWFSPSNREVQGITGLETNITADVSDAQTDANLLNENGIVTFYPSAGIRTWGNRSMAFPTFTDPENFLSIRMTIAVIKDSLEDASLQFIDQPLDDALIDQLLETVNGFLRTLIVRGALIDGESFYDPTKNPPSQLANGQLVLGVRYMPPPPLERLTYETFLDVNILSQLGGNQ